MQVLVKNYDGSFPQFVVPLYSHYPLCAIVCQNYMVHLALWASMSDYIHMHPVSSSAVLGA